MTNNDLYTTGQRLQVARQQLAEATAAARTAAIKAVAEGATEVDVARALGIDRARTLRRWLGK